MDDDQQFCLRWNNHQSTLISVFDTLLENETLVDCTLAAEGKFLKAHKVVLSACSPYFATLLSEQYDKHPIFILKDVKYQELRAMMDYMYRGEVNISQDQLAALLKAAESLQIKGLSDNRSSGNNSQKSADHKQHVPGKLIGGGGSSGLGGGLGGISGIGGGVASSIGSGYTLEQTKRARVGPSSIDSQDMSRSREGSSSPTSRRRRKIRRRSIENTMSDIHENSNSSQIQIQQSSVPTQSSASNILGGVSAIAAAAAAAAAAAGMTTNIASSGTVLSSASQQQQQHTSASTSLSSLAAASSTTPGSLATAAAAAAAAQTSGNLITTNVTKKTESVSKIIGNTDAMNMDNIPDDNEKDVITKKDQQQNNHKQQRLSKLIDTSSSSVAGKDTDMVIEPKSEYDDDANDETVEDLTLDDEEMGLEDLDHNAGPSHGGEGSSQGYGQWPIDRSQDEVFMAAQEAQQRDPQVKHDKSEQTDITPDEFELDDCLLESNDIVITQNKDGFVLHVKKVGGNITTSKITAVDEEQAAAAAVAAASGVSGDSSGGGGQLHITDIQNVTEVKPSLTTLTTSHAIRLPSSECELINLKKVIPTGSTTITGHHHHHHQQQQQLHQHQQQQQQQHHNTTTATIIQPQLHHQEHQHHTTNLITSTPQTINTLIGLRGVQIEPKTIHSRIKYSRGKIITQPGATVQLENPEKTITTHHDLPETTKYEISEIDLNNPQASASIISDLVKYAEIDDIELPDGTKIGIGFAPTEITEHMQHTTQSTQMSADEQSSEQDQHHHHQQQQQQQHQQQQQQQHQHHQLHQHHDQHLQHHQNQDEQDEGEEFETIQQDQDLTEQVSVHQVEQPTTITKSYTILTTRPMKQEMSTTTTTTTYELSLSDSSLGQSDDIDSKYICRHCGKKYRWKSTLRRHENVECGGKEPCHPCPHCSYKAKQRGNLGVHVRKHHPDKPQLESKRGRK